MGNKTAGGLLALVILAAAAPARAELLKLSLLEKPAPRFTVKLDLFRGGEAAAPQPASRADGPVAAETLQQSIADEIAQSVSFDGYIVKSGTPLALLNVSGDFFTVSEGETILGKIRVLKITRQTVTIEYDGQPYDIRTKGE